MGVFPLSTSGTYRGIGSSPRSWGCFSGPDTTTATDLVFPTLVGVFLGPRHFTIGCVGLPHARGGVSSISGPLPSGRKSSPRSWGCFLLPAGLLPSQRVFPTLVGVFLSLRSCVHLPTRLPHARGGVSRPASRGMARWPSSPRSWGCFPAPAADRLPWKVFPTLVGVFPVARWIAALAKSLPHARGGVSLEVCALPARAWSSPRSWGCFFDTLESGGC